MYSLGSVTTECETHPDVVAFIHGLKDAVMQAARWMDDADIDNGFRPGMEESDTRAHKGITEASFKLACMTYLHEHRSQLANDPISEHATYRLPDYLDFTGGFVDIKLEFLTATDNEHVLIELKITNPSYLLHSSRIRPVSCRYGSLFEAALINNAIPSASVSALRTLLSDVVSANFGGTTADVEKVRETVLKGLAVRWSEKSLGAQLEQNMHQAKRYAEPYLDHDRDYRTIPVKRVHCVLLHLVGNEHMFMEISARRHNDVDVDPIADEERIVNIKNHSVAVVERARIASAQSLAVERRVFPSDTSSLLSVEHGTCLANDLDPNILNFVFGLTEPLLQAARWMDPTDLDNGYRPRIKGPTEHQSRKEVYPKNAGITEAGLKFACMTYLHEYQSRIRYNVGLISALHIYKGKFAHVEHPARLPLEAHMKLKFENGVGHEHMLIAFKNTNPAIIMSGQKGTNKRYSPLFKQADRLNVLRINPSVEALCTLLINDGDKRNSDVETAGEDVGTRRETVLKRLGIQEFGGTSSGLEVELKASLEQIRLDAEQYIVDNPDPTLEKIHSVLLHLVGNAHMFVYVQTHKKTHQAPAAAGNELDVSKMSIHEQHS
uniref:Uncharacterized protein n=1 Tax=Mantoniella antarctica TaxID=81844 RepID=A0A7S0X951_9CHLO|mmetsp:Transcript_27928/g.70163  ORF Transcript_27928/g.70163 Transcript_27928/m.70163 type:complete len:607 (+) Transcript_27928:165-1985(+)|eukprot:CAMPEP_0181354154 /NCGR_PEP_ID=MMETSP1106-20121128/3210_1 /TAXON_ID=81844 /ORGANISM="Mantoniella antarctica, Strain SL-175" /LENGTH=606 /DNA_ID=CAMNT_0023466799 /DNA_START=148 /DNA_END=1968 /DNA_ORIENTATION=-